MLSTRGQPDVFNLRRLTARAMMRSRVVVQRPEDDVGGEASHGEHFDQPHKVFHKVFVAGGCGCRPRVAAEAVCTCDYGATQKSLRPRRWLLSRPTRPRRDVRGHHNCGARAQQRLCALILPRPREVIFCPLRAALAAFSRFWGPSLGKICDVPTQ